MAMAWATLASPAVAAPASDTLPPDIDIALDRARLPRDALAVVVQEVGAPASSTPRLAWRSQTPMNPASLMKLLTTTAALDLLGPAYTWQTPVWLQGTLGNGVLNGNVFIKGSGDPKLVMERLWLLLRRVQQFGVREIRGDIVLDRSAFSVAEQAPGQFDGEPFRPYNVQPDALLINYKSVVLTFTPDTARNVAAVSIDPPLAGVRSDVQVPLSNGPCDDWRAVLKADFSDPARLRMAGSYPTSCGERFWPIAYADPKAYNERTLTGLWQDMGGKLTGRVRDGTAPATPPHFSVSSPALAELVRDINKFSNNVMAQQVFLTLGLVQRGSGTTENGREVLRQWLVERHGDAAQGAVVDNGSGLSRETRVSARLLSQVLQGAWGSAVMPELMSSLPVAGVDGTMRRSRNAPLGRSHLKTGSLRDVSGIAGYVLANSGRRYVVIALVNHPQAAAAKPVLEAVATWAALDAENVPAPPAGAAVTAPPRAQ
jgi:D-alanyl-D-alanine carboxypeptidase/D-alanyl-D-alanine-endopeptidase (penicillin-binding protein 4)